MLLPFIDLNGLTHFPLSHYVLFVASVALTLCSYLTFAEALRHLEASRTGVVVALTPLLTVAMAAVAALFTDRVETEPLNALALLGALLVVAGSTATSRQTIDIDAICPCFTPHRLCRRLPALISFTNDDRSCTRRLFYGVGQCPYPGWTASITKILSAGIPASRERKHRDDAATSPP